MNARLLFILIVLSSVLHAQDQIIPISRSAVYPTQLSGIQIAKDGRVWISFVSDSLEARAGYFDGSQFVTTFRSMLPYRYFPAASIQSVFDASMRPWFIYLDGYGSPVRVGFLQGNNWHQVDSIDWTSQYGLARDPDGAIWYYYAHIGSTLTLFGKVWSHDSLSPEQTIVDDPRIGPYERGPTILRGAVASSNHGLVSTLYYTFMGGLLGNPPINYVSLAQLSIPRKQIVLQTASSYQGSYTEPLVIALCAGRVLIATRDQSYRGYVFELDTSITRSWQDVITPLDSRFRYQVSASGGQFVTAFTWLAFDKIYTRLFNGDGWYKQHILADSISDSLKSYPRITIQGDSLLWVAYIALKNGQSQMFLARTRPNLALDNLITSVEHVSGGGFSASDLFYQNYPNPFNPRTNIHFRLATAQHVELKIFTVLGQEIATLADANFGSGDHVIDWTPGVLSSGMYICRIRTNSFISSIKLLLVK
jgi:hypothetical protein